MKVDLKIELMGNDISRMLSDKRTKEFGCFRSPTNPRLTAPNVCMTVWEDVVPNHFKKSAARLERIKLRLRRHTKRIGTLSLFIVAALSLSFAQTSARTILDLGSVTVWLGMPKQEVMANIATAGYKVVNRTDKYITVMSNDTVFTIAFRGERLVYADRDWYNAGREPFDAVLECIRSLNDKGEYSCSVLRDDVSSPESFSKRVFITCGKRSILLMDSQIGKTQVISVIERIGVLPQ